MIENMDFEFFIKPFNAPTEEFMGSLNEDELVQYLAFAKYWGEESHYQTIIDAIVERHRGDKSLHQKGENDGYPEECSFNHEIEYTTYYGFTITTEPGVEPRYRSASGKFYEEEIKRIVLIFWDPFQI